MCYLLSQLFPQVSHLNTGRCGWVLCSHMPIAHLNIFLGSQEEPKALCICPCQSLSTQGWMILSQLLGTTNQTKPVK